VDSLATLLALAEFVGTLAIVLLLVVSLAWKRQLIMPALVAAIVFGIVFANPFGVVAEPSAANARSLNPSSEADSARHWVKVGGVPVAWFTPYDQPYPWAGLYENSPNSVLKLRYGFSFLPTTGATSVVEQCSNYIGDPCWRDRPDDYPLVHRDAVGRALVVPLTKTLVPNRQGESGYPSVPHVYEARLGVASWRSTAYWFGVGVALLLAARMSRLRLRGIGIAIVVSLAVGVMGAGALALVPTPERSSASVTPDLLPEPADAPPVSRTAQTTPIESFGAGCVETVDGVARNTCGRVDRLTAVETAGGMLAIWTAEADGLMHFRTRRLSSRGEPLDAGSTTVRSWSQTASSGQWNCEIPAELQAVRLARGDVLVAWSSVCDLRGGTGGPASIMGAVLGPSGDLVGEPFRILGYDRGSTAEPRPRYWLRASSSGEPFLFWEAPTRAAYHGRALFMSPLDARLQAVEATEIMNEEHGIGSVAVACGASCFVAQGLGGAITLHVLGGDGQILRREVVAPDPTALRSELAADADGDRYVAGWLESDGVNVDGYVAMLELDDPPIVRAVARRIPNGDGTDASTPDPLGVVADRFDSTLVFQTSTDADDEFVIRVATRASVDSRSIDVRLGEPTLAKGVLVAIAGLWPAKPAEPVSVVVR